MTDKFNIEEIINGHTEVISSDCKSGNYLL
jgi:hypothetical protein